MRHTLLFYLLLLPIFFVGYFVHSYFFIPDSPKSVSVPRPSSNVEDASYDFDQYQNSSYGFSFEYPKSVVVKESYADFGEAMKPRGKPIVTVEEPDGTLLFSIYESDNVKI